MLEVYRNKKTKQIIHPIGKAETANHTMCLFPYGRQAKNGSRGVIQPVRNENIVKDRESF